MYMYMATSILALHRDFGLMVHHGNSILTGGATAPPDPSAFPPGEGCRPPSQTSHPRVMRGFAPQTPQYQKTFRGGLEIQDYSGKQNRSGHIYIYIYIFITPTHIKTYVTML